MRSDGVLNRLIKTDHPVSRLFNCNRDDYQLWPRDNWPAMRFARRLQVGAIGGHGPIRYFIESYEPGKRIQFRFTTPAGFKGIHRFGVEPVSMNAVRLYHLIEMKLSGWAWLSWPLIFRPLHDALIEDALNRAEYYVTLLPAKKQKCSLWVRVPRRVFSQHKKRSLKSEVTRSDE